ncbi:hypothetical protein ACNQFZ_03720 [Schinkia sp. CFF1]
MAKYILVITSFLFFIMNDPALARSNIENLMGTKEQRVAAVKENSEQQEKSISVKHQVKGNDVYIECVISNFMFSKREDRNSNKNGYGFMQLYLNGKKIDEIYTAAFIIKGLPVGKHLIKLELVQNDGTPYKIEEEFEVTI